MGVKTRAARSRELIAKGKRPAVVARVLQVNRSGLYRVPQRRPRGQRRPAIDPVDRLIVEVARANPTDGTRMVAALTSQRLDHQVNRKRAQRVMREQRLLQRHRPLRRRRRPGFFRVERPDQLWHLDMTSVWVAEHGWTYLHRHDILVAYYHIVRDRVPYRELGPDWLARRYSPEHRARRLVRQLEALGFNVSMEAAA